MSLTHFLLYSQITRFQSPPYMIDQDESSSQIAGLTEEALDSTPPLKEDHVHSITPRSSSLPNHIFGPWILHFCLFSITIVIIILNLRTETDCVRKHSYYCTLSIHSVQSCKTKPASPPAPVLSLVGIDPQIRHFNNSDHTFRGPPSESVSKVWDQLTESTCKEATRSQI